MSDTASKQPELPTSAVSVQGLMPRGVTSFGAVTHGGSLYVLGGYFGVPHEYDKTGQSNSFARMNLADGSWEELPSPGPMQSVALVEEQDQLYRIGGMVILNDVGEAQRLQSSAEFARFDPLRRDWVPMPDLPAPRSSHMATIQGGIVWVAGGWNLHPGEEATWHDTLLRFDLNHPEAKWESIDAPFQSRALGVCALDDKVLMIGGMSAAGIQSDVRVYEPANARWSDGPNFPGSAFGLSAMSVGKSVFASGRDGMVYRWTPGEAEWHLVTSLAFPRFFHQLVRRSDNELLAVGGIGPGGRIRHIESLTTDAVRAEVVSSVWTIPAPGQAKNRQGIFIKDNALYAFGGNRSLEQHDFEPEDFLSEAFMLDLANLSWSPIADFPVRQQSMLATLADGDNVALSIGGFGHDGEAARSHAQVYQYDTKYDDWSLLPKGLAQPRSQFGLVRQGNSLWIFGGLDYDPSRERSEDFQYPLEVLQCEIGSDMDGEFASTSVQLPRPRRAAGTALLHERCYMIGGLREGFESVQECDVFDFKTSEWSVIPAPRRPRLSPELVALGDRLYLAGGSSDRGDGFAPDSSVEVFDPATNEWSVLLEELPVPAKHLQMFAFRDRLLLFSLHNDDALAHVVLLDIGNTSLGEGVRGGHSE